MFSDSGSSIVVVVVVAAEVVVVVVVRAVVVDYSNSGSRLRSDDDDGDDDTSNRHIDSLMQKRCESLNFYVLITNLLLYIFTRMEGVGGQVHLNGGRCNRDSSRILAPVVLLTHGLLLLLVFSPACRMACSSTPASGTPACRMAGLVAV